MRKSFVITLSTFAALSWSAEASASSGENSVGLSLWWENGEVRFEDGSPKTVELYEDFKRHVHELDITASVETTTDQGIQPIIEEGDMSDLNWTGIEFVEEDWRPAFDGTFTRSRFFRGARWMERWSAMMLLPVDESDRPTGAPILVNAGSDNSWLPSDGAFIRRFVARQLTFACPAIGDCTGATRFVAQGLMQLRSEMDAGHRATRIPNRTESLKLLWTEDLGNPRYVAVEHAKYDDSDWEYGFAVDLEVTNPPANGLFYLPGDSVNVKVTFTDGVGNPLHADGSLPSYLEFMNDDIPSGLRYYDGLQQLLTLYYAHKHREGLTMWSLSGPTDRLRYSSHVTATFDFFIPQATMATVTEDGFSALSILNPSIPAQSDPSLIPLPNPDNVTFTLPLDALPGTYVIAVKGRRDFGGEALNRAGTLDIQVGQAEFTPFAPTTGNCNSCHQDETALGNILHGLDDRRACYSCHSTLEFEPDHALDYRIHLIHTRSERVPGNPNDCSMCHLTPPTGLARGFMGIGPF